MEYKYITKYLPIPNRINPDGSNTMFLIDNEWTEPMDFDSIMGSGIQDVAGGILFLVSDSNEPIELADQTLDTNLIFNRNDFEVKWVNTKGETSLTKNDVDSEETPATLKAFILKK